MLPALARLPSRSTLAHRPSRLQAQLKETHWRWGGREVYSSLPQLYRPAKGLATKAMPDKTMTNEKPGTSPLTVLFVCDRFDRARDAIVARVTRLVLRLASAAEWSGASAT